MLPKETPGKLRVSIPPEPRVQCSMHVILEEHLQHTPIDDDAVNE